MKQLLTKSSFLKVLVPFFSLLLVFNIEYSNAQGTNSTISGGGTTNFTFGSVMTRKFQTLYIASDFTVAPETGEIQTLWFQRTTSTASTSEQNFEDFEIRLGNTADETFSGTNFFDDGDLTLVYDGALTIPAGDADTWFAIELQTPFEYDSTQNLIFDTRLITPGDPHATGFAIRWNPVPIPGTPDTKRLQAASTTATSGIPSETRFNFGITLDPTLGLNEPSANSSIQLFPNPAQYSIQVNGLTPQIEVLEIYNTLGQQVYAQDISQRNISSPMVIDISRFTTGIYFLKAGNNSYRFIKN